MLTRFELEQKAAALVSMTNSRSAPEGACEDLAVELASNAAVDLRRIADALETLAAPPKG